MIVAVSAPFEDTDGLPGGASGGGDAEQVVRELVSRGLTLATAESLTGGGLGELLTAVPGASAVYLGGVISYATEVKVALLGVPGDVVERDGVVSAACALAMARGVRSLLGSDVGVATTGVAGPDRQEGKPVGRVHVAVADGAGEAHIELRLSGDRRAIRSATGQAALRMVLARIGCSG
jgi:nicotinamide-nucleotide amidase